ncbi:hypothetical protein RSOL_511790 [Rhizoctonia solani AG-3 Rhs1AP]|uniref:Uncharacterized protein n=1 Tax=Rhizoctonia solani AG-3 Rhs1AP TaxID=1086054 RepID=X8JWE9_9AGAM|nr:hypothetical protein RSOL_511790 [Rhizoctonia solani AG-3 Rhs1AP]
MSAPERNPDTRPLPPGFITQFDTNYHAWFYVNTNTNPPTTQWTHPANDQKPASYAPPQGPPPSGGPGFPQIPGGSPYPQSNSPYPPQNNSPYPLRTTPLILERARRTPTRRVTAPMEALQKIVDGGAAPIHLVNGIKVVHPGVKVEVGVKTITMAEPLPLNNQVKDLALVVCLESCWAVVNTAAQVVVVMVVDMAVDMAEQPVMEAAMEVTRSSNLLRNKAVAWEPAVC